MVSSVADRVSALMSTGGQHCYWSVAAFLPHVVLFSVAFGYWKCYYSPCFGRGGRRILPPIESTGNDIVRELIGIARAASAANAPIHPRTHKSICNAAKQSPNET